MAEIRRYFDIHLTRGNKPKLVIHVNQYDENEVWEFTIYDSYGALYSPSSAQIIGIKRDGHAILNNATVNSSKHVVVTETKQMTAVDGLNEFELILEGKHGTANFLLNVERRPGGEDSDYSDSDLSLMNEAIDASAKAISAAEESKQAATTAGNAAKEAQEAASTVVYSAKDSWFSNFTLSRILRDVRLTNKYSTSWNEGENAFVSQGSCYIPSNNSMVVAYTNKYNNTGKLIEYSLTTKKMIRESSDIEIGHANGMYYDSETGYIYLAPSTSRVKGEASSWYGLIRIEYARLIVDKTFETNDRFLTINKDPITGAWWASKERVLYKISDISNMTYSKVCDLPYEDWTDQGCFVWNNYAFKLTYNPSAIRIYDIENGGLIKVIPIADSYGQFIMAEPQAITILENGHFYMTSDAHSYWETAYMMQLWEGDIYKNTAIYGDIYATVPQDVIVDNSYATQQNTDLNPTGSTSKPFPYLIDVEFRLKNAQTWTRAVKFVNPEKTTAHTFNEILTIRDCNILLSVDSGYVDIAGLNLENANVVLDSLTIGNGSMPNNLYELRSQYSHVIFHNCTLNGNIHFNRSDMNSTGLTLGTNYSYSKSAFNNPDTCSEILPGDTYYPGSYTSPNTMSAYGSGFLTASGTSVRVVIYLPKKLSAFCRNPTVTGKYNVRHSAGGYIQTETDASNIKDSYHLLGNALKIQYTIEAVSGVPNNTPVSFEFMSGTAVTF